MKENRISGIYCWTSPVNKKYVGQSIDLADRKTCFLTFTGNYTSKTGRLSKIDKARQKYNDAKYWTYEILEECPIEKLDDEEIYWIAYYDSFYNGYNSNLGGASNPNRLIRLIESFKPDYKYIINYQVVQLDLDENFIKEWKNSQAVVIDGIPADYELIHEVCFQQSTEYMGYKWVFKHDYEYVVKENTDLDEYLYSKYCLIGKKYTAEMTKSVVQLDRDGNFIKEWDSITEAAMLFVGKERSHIGECCASQLKSAYGCLWLFKKDYEELMKNPDLFREYLENHKRKRIHTKPSGKRKPIVQLTRKDEFVRYWDCAKDAADNYGIVASAIAQCCQGSVQATVNFKWMYKNDYEKMLKDNSNPDEYKGCTVQSRTKYVVQLRTNGEIVKIHESQTEAFKSVNTKNTDARNISKACANMDFIIFGYIWMYEDDFNQKFGSMSEEERKEYFNKRYSDKIKQKHVVKLSQNGEYIEEYESMAAASLPISGKSYSLISSLKEHEIKNVYEYKWMLKDDYEDMINHYESIEAYDKIYHPEPLQTRIVQLTLDGDFVAEYKDGNEAMMALRGEKDTHSMIRRCCNGLRKQGFGYRWMFKEDYERTLQEDPSKLYVSIEYKTTTKFPIVKLSKDGELVGRFKSANEAAKSCDSKNSKLLQEICHGKYDGAFGYRWMNANDYDTLIEKLGIEAAEKVIAKKPFNSFPKLEPHKVIQMDLNGNKIKIWNSCKEAGLELFGKIKGGIMQCCCGRQESAYGYRWQYID